MSAQKQVLRMVRMALSVMAACELEFVGEVEMGSMVLLVLMACEPVEARSRCENTDDLGETCHDHAQPPPRPSHNSDPSPATPKLIAVPQLNPGHYVNLQPRTSLYHLLAMCPV